LAVDDLSEPPPDNYYDPENVESRWRKTLSSLEIKMIEWSTNDIFNNFSYTKDPPVADVNLIRIWINLLFGYNRSFYSGERQVPIIRKLRDFTRRCFVIFFPNYASKLFRIL
jgi:hypothetical protein